MAVDLSNNTSPCDLNELSVVIMAGGKGTRLSSLGLSIPKPMVQIAGKPILEWQLENLAAQGVQKATIVVSARSNHIQKHFGQEWTASHDKKECHLIALDYFIEKEPLGTAGALSLLKAELKPQILLINGDLVFKVNFRDFLNRHLSHKGGQCVTLLAQPSDHPFDSALLEVDDNSKVIAWDPPGEKRNDYRNLANSGLHLMARDCIPDNCQDEKMRPRDLDRELLHPLFQQDLLYAYISCEYVRDAGTPQRLAAIEEDIKQEIPKRLSGESLRKAIFLDRDGTINRQVGYVTSPEQLELIAGTSKAIAQMRRLGYVVIVITNQAAVQRGTITAARLEEIHKRLETLLGDEGSYVDAMYYCPHAPEHNCACRKPLPGMILAAARDYKIDLAASWMIGDAASDMQAGQTAGCKLASVGGLKMKDIAHYENLLEFAEVELCTKD